MSLLSRWRKPKETSALDMQATALASKASSRGLIDPQKLIAATEKLQKLIDDENESRKKRLADLEGTSAEFRKAITAIYDAENSPPPDEPDGAALVETTSDVVAMKPLRLTRAKAFPQ